MADCNIRNIDPRLLRSIKVLAAKEGMTLKQWLVSALWDAVSEHSAMAADDDGRVEYVSQTHHAASCKCLMCKPKHA